VTCLLTLSAAAAEPAAVGGPAHPPEHLSGTGLYLPGPGHRVHPEALPFSPQYPLWTDGAEKQRWIRLPHGAAIDATRPDAWDFPVGTRLWKEFRFAGRPVETRYMERTAAGWAYATYLWSADGADATRAPDGGVPEAYPLGGGESHTVPGTGDCVSCHGGRTTPVLGFSALQLSPDRDPLAPHQAPPAPGDVDLPALVGRGLLRGLPPALLAHPPRVPTADPVERAALGYLHGNCGGCHNAEGPLAPVGLELWQPVEGGRLPARETALGVEGLFHLPDADGGSGVRVAAGQPEASTLFRRAATRDPFTQMPPLGTRLLDRAAVELLQKWITSLERSRP
jgi:hypothetical protein